ncbi:hypothetical protein QVN91_07800 [Bacteroides caecigallinarum]|nr:hypothetical protein [Bacteroides caecigallinarum]
MKYGKLINEKLDIIEVENGMELNGILTEEDVKMQGYKPVCETEKPDKEAIERYTEYDKCIVQEWEIGREMLIM